jgi:LytS/YehU family sensor histidine kinase
MKLEAAQRLNRARMNPHFFFNALSSLQAFALQENDGKALAINLSKFSHSMRETLESTYKEYVTIDQEKDFLNEYLEFQKIRFPQKFTYAIKISDGIEQDDLLIPSMILQTFVENSIEYGFTGIDYAGHISINFEKGGTDLQIKISDNRKGLSAIAKEENEHISRASQIIKDGIYLLNIKLKTKAAFRINNSKMKKE